MAGITLAIAWCSESENSSFRMSVWPLCYFDHTLFFFDLCFLKLRKIDVQDAILDIRLDVVFVDIVGEDQCLMELRA